MPYNEKSYQASVKYKAKNIKRIPLDVQMDHYERIVAAAKAAGKSVNGYIKDAIEKQMEADKHDVG